MKNKLRMLSLKASYYTVAGWIIYHIVRPILKPVTNPLLNWIEHRLTLRYVPKHSLIEARLLLDMGRDPSSTELDYFFSIIQSSVWHLGWTYMMRGQQQHIKDLVAKGQLDNALKRMLRFKSDQPWDRRMVAEIYALQNGQILPPVIEPAEGLISWSKEQILAEELPKWRAEDIDYILAELYLRWGYQAVSHGVNYKISSQTWEEVMRRVKGKFPAARILNWHGSMASHTHKQYQLYKTEPEERARLDAMITGENKYGGGTMKLILLFLMACSVPATAQTLTLMVNEMTVDIQHSTGAKVAVLEFNYADNKTSQGPAIVQERITTALVQKRVGVVVERKLLDRVMGELKLQRSGIMDERTIKQIGKVLGVDYVVTGTLNDTGKNKTEVNARVIDVETAKVIGASSTEIAKTWEDVALSAAIVEPRPVNVEGRVLLKTKAYMDARLAELRSEVGKSILPREDGMIVVNDTVAVKPEQFSDAVMKTILNGVKESSLAQPPVAGVGEEEY